jgi:hypothetical protein
MKTSKVMKELWKTKEELSLQYIAMTPEERKQKSLDTRKWVEEKMGRPLKYRDKPLDYCEKQ